MTTALSEDDVYRTSSQYKLWSFSPESLVALRLETRRLAVERLRRYEANRSDGAANGHDRNKPATMEYLTEAEELRLVQKYCDQIRATSEFFNWPVNVKATAVQYLKRFYLSNSCMTYPPKEIYKTALFLACKTESTHMTLSEYARRISTDPEQVLAPEYKLMQGLRFTLDIKQPYRGLKGVLMEMLNMAAGTAHHVDIEGRTGEQLQSEMQALDPPGAVDRTVWKQPDKTNMDDKHLNDRVQAAYFAARTILDAPALLTDVYFLYTPSQMLLAAMQLADSTLSAFYLSTKFSLSSPLRLKILATIRSCMEMLAAHHADQVLTKDERAALEKKLEECRDPRTRDLVKAFAAMKQGGDGDAEEMQEKAKRRKLEREKSMQEGEDLFGPVLSKPSAKGGSAG